MFHQAVMLGCTKFESWLGYWLFGQTLHEDYDSGTIMLEDCPENGGSSSSVGWYLSAKLNGVTYQKINLHPL
jgi:hypothetical protein